MNDFLHLSKFLFFSTLSVYFFDSNNLTRTLSLNYPEIPDSSNDI